MRGAWPVIFSNSTCPFIGCARFMMKLKLLYVIIKLEFSQVLENPFQSSVKRAKYSSDTSHTVPLCVELGMDFSEPVKRLIAPFIALISLVI